MFVEFLACSVNSFLRAPAIHMVLVTLLPQTLSVPPRGNQVGVVGGKGGLVIFFTLQNCIDSGELAPIRLLTVKQALANIINFVGCESFSYVENIVETKAP